MSAEQRGLLSMEQLFREAMLLHRNTVQELIHAKERIDQIQQAKKSLLDKARSFQQRCVILGKENKELQDAKQKSIALSDQGCRTCSYLQQSMDSLGEAYNKTLQEKDRTIKMLEERLAEVTKRDHSKTSHQKLLEKAKSPDTTSEKCMRHLDDLKKGTSPDSTNSRSVKSTQGFQMRKGDAEDVHGINKNDIKASLGSGRSDKPAAVSPAPGNVTDREISPASRKKLLTLAKEKKKNRYQESTTTEDKTNLEHREGNGVESSQKSSKKFAESPEKPQLHVNDDQNAIELGSNRICSKRQRFSEEDGSFSSDYDDGDTRRTRKLRRKEAPSIIVPETLAVDYFADGEINDSDLENEVPVENLNSVPLGGSRGDNLNIGPPSASSTQIVRPGSKKKSVSLNPGSNLDQTGNVFYEIDHDITVLEKNNTVAENISTDITCRELSINTNESCLEKEGHLSPVFIGSKNFQKVVGSPSSPCLFEDENKMADEMDGDILEEDSQSPFLLRQPVSSDQRSNHREQVLLDADDSQSPLLLHGTRSKRTNQSNPVKLSLNRSDVSQSNMNRSLRRSARGQKTAEKELKQTTLTQAFDDRFNKQTEFKVVDLENFSNKSGKITAQFKKPRIESVRKKSTLQSEKKAFGSRNPTQIDVNNFAKPILTLDLDETLAPDPTTSTVGGKVLPSYDHNASLDPDVQLTLDFPDSMVTDNLERGKKNENKLNFHASESKSIEEESQWMPCSSKSVKFVGKPNICNEAPEDTLQNEDMDEGVSDLEVEEKEGVIYPDVSLHSSFDRVPKLKGPDYAYVDVVRKKDERRKLNAFFCQECEDYFTAMGLPEEERANRMQNCSRHRARYVPPSTPEHFWSIGFPDTPECEERGYIRKESPKGPSRFRRKKRLEKRFKTTNEDKNEDEEPEEDLNTSELIFDL